MGKSKNNKGFTLTELIIAVAVLGIVISPLVANFIQSARLNKKARVSLDATNMAQDIMEGASAYTAEEFVKMFESNEYLVNKILPATTKGYSQHGDLDDSGNSSFGVVFNSDGTVGGIDGTRLYAENIVDEKATKIKKISDAYFYIKNAKIGKNEYDLVFYLNTNKTKHTQNGKYVANIAKINTTYDATSNLGSSEIEAAATEFLSKSSKAGVKTAADFAKVMNRNIEIRIENKSSSGMDYAIGIYRTYTIPSAYYTELGITAANDTVIRSDANISMLQETQLPRSVYLYFEGMESTSKSNVTETFTVNNNTGKEITVYLIRTQTETEMTTNTLYNQNYGTKVDVVSTDFNGATPNYLTKIVSNLRYNLSEEAKDNIRVYQEGSTTEYVADRGYNSDTALNTKYDANRCKYTYNGSAVDENLYLTNFSDGYEEEEKNFIYELNLEVREATSDNTLSGKVIATFTGSLSD